MAKKYDYRLAKKRWREVCEEYDDIPIYSKAWYWDATVGNTDAWDVILYEKKDIIAALPFIYRRAHGMKRIEAPWQVSRSGIWLHSNKELSIEKKLHCTNDIIDYIIENLPKYDLFSINFDTTFDNWSPFYWRGFTCWANYTYVIKNTVNSDVRNTFSRRRRQRVNAGARKYEIRLNNIDVEDVLSFYQNSYNERNKTLSVDLNKLRNLLTSVRSYNAMQIRSAHYDGKIVAIEVAFIDNLKIYHQFCSHLPEHPDAQSCIVYNTIQYALDNNLVFDFEGSMIKGPAEFYISFMPEIEVCYFIIDKSAKYRILSGIKKELIGLIKK